MKIRPKTVRRLLILATGAAVLTGTVAIAFTARRMAREAQIADARAAGLSAYESRDYARALDSLGKYIVSRPNDVEALFALGSSRMAMETPSRDSLFDAMLRFKRLLEIDPNHSSASLKLLEVYEKTNQAGEMLELSGRVLQRSPDDAAAMRFHAIALTRLKKTADARAAWQKLVALTPHDVSAQSQLLSAMRADGVDAEQLIEYAQKLVADNPNDPRFQIPLATALRDAGQEAQSLEVLKRLTANPPADAEAVMELVTMLDRAGAFDDAQRVLERAAETLQSSMLSSALVQRVWQGGRAEGVIALTDRLIAAGPAQPSVLALRALSLASLDRRDEANRIVQKLADGESASERAWSEALRVEFSTTPLTPAQRVDALSKALGRDPNNAIIYTWLARALLQIGEIDQAARCYRESAQRMPSWPTPCIELAQAMLAAGRTEEAIPAAKAAYLRSPSGAASQVQLARVRFAALQERFDADEQALLLKYVTALRESLTDEPSLLSIQIALLARSDQKPEAVKVLESALRRASAADVFVALYGVDRAYSLGQADAIVRQAGQTSQLSPRLLTQYAQDLIGQGRQKEAAALADQLATSATTSADAALAEARVRSALGDTTAPTVWRLAATRFPDNLRLQMAVLEEAVPLLNDRALQQQLIEQVRALTSDDGVYWQIEKAKFLAASEKPDDVRAAMTLASELLRQQPMRTDLRVLLGRILTRLDSPTTALEHLRAAYEQSPANPAVGLELVDAFAQLGRNTDTQAVLKRLSTLDIEDAGLRNRLLKALGDNGQTDDLLAMLQRLSQRQLLDAPGQLLLAETLASSQQPDAARAVYDRLLVANPSPAALASAAAFHRELGETDAATTLLDRIPSAPGSEASRRYAVARYHLKFGDTDAARTAFAAMVQDPSCDPAMLRDAIALEASTRNFDRCTQLLQSGRKRFGNHPILDRAEVELAALQSDNVEVAMEKLIGLLSRDASSKPEVDALKASLEARKTGQVTPDLAMKLVQLADRYPAAFELQREAIAACVATNLSGQAITIAHRVSNLAGTRSEMQELAARTLAHFGQWNGARKVAERWRGQLGPNPREADLLLSAIAYASGDPARAITLSEPYASGLNATSDQQALTVRAAALLDVGRADEGFALLEPWLASSADVRASWQRLMVAAPNASVLGRLEQLVRALPEAATEERIRTAAACLSISERLEGTEAATIGLALISPIAGMEGATEQTRILRAELLRSCGEPALAEAELRALLIQLPDSGRAKNSLAYLLLTQNRDVAEALRLASEAASSLPNRANVIDTHARALLESGDIAGAVARFNEALRIDPDYLDALIGLARALHQQGNLASASELVTRIDLLLSRGDRRYVPAHLRSELGSLRQSISVSRD